MKKHYTVTLDEEAVTVVKKFLTQTSGTSFSGFLNAICVELANEMQGQPVVLDKPLKDMTLEEFGKYLSHWTALVSST